MEYSFKFPEKKRITAVINGQEYSFTVSISIDDYNTIVEELKEDDPSYKDMVSEIVLNNACDDESDELIEIQLPDELLDTFVREVISTNSEISTIYSKRSEEDCYERFILSAKEYYENEAKKAMAGLPDMDAISRTLSCVQSVKISPVLFDTKSINPGIASIAKNLSHITEATIQAQRIANSVIESLRPVIEKQRTIIDGIVKSISQIVAKTPLYSESRIEEIKNSVIKWGEYGWTIPPYARFKDFFIEPASIKEANKVMRQYCRKESMNKLFELTKEIKGVRQSDYSEAIDNYNSSHYKSCALIMYSLFDARLIRSQKKVEAPEKSKWRDVGEKAVKKSREQVLNDLEIEKLFITMLRFENVYAFLAKTFENANDFKRQPEVINRNFLDHGMLTRRVLKRDCDQLFLLYYNWLSLLDPDG